MPLSDDQRAMLRTLAQREQGYEDLAALMGLSVDEVRARVKDALEQLEAEGKAPSAPSEAPEQPALEPEPEPAAPPKAAAEPAKRPAPPRPSIALPKSGAARAAIAGALVLVALVVVLALGGGGSGSGGATTTGSGESAPPTEAAASNPTVNGKEVTRAILSAVGGGGGKGVATFGRVKNSLALQIEASGLAPTGKGRSYTVWLYESPQKMLPLAATAVGGSGKIAAQIRVPTEVLGYLANETFGQIDVSLTSDAALKASLAKATSEKKAPLYTGTDVLRGRVTGPIVGAAKK
jgi:hypothetical protein